MSAVKMSGNECDRILRLEMSQQLSKQLNKELREELEVVKAVQNDLLQTNIKILYAVYGVIVFKILDEFGFSGLIKAALL